MCFVRTSSFMLLNAYERLSYCISWDFDIWHCRWMNGFKLFMRILIVYSVTLLSFLSHCIGNIKLVGLVKVLLLQNHILLVHITLYLFRAFFVTFKFCVLAVTFRQEVFWVSVFSYLLLVFVHVLVNLQLFCVCGTRTCMFVSFVYCFASFGLACRNQYCCCFL